MFVCSCVLILVILVRKLRLTLCALFSWVPAFLLVALLPITAYWNSSSTGHLRGGLNCKSDCVTLTFFACFPNSAGWSHLLGQPSLILQFSLSAFPPRGWFVLIIPPSHYLTLGMYKVNYYFIPLTPILYQAIALLRMKVIYGWINTFIILYIRNSLSIH